MADNPREGASGSSGPRIIRPIPRRPFNLNFSSPTPPEEDDDTLSPRPQISASDLQFLNPHQHATTPGPRDGSTPLSHTTSYLNLTSPTLYGIYSPSTIGSFNNNEDDPDQYFANRTDVLAAAGSTDTPLDTLAVPPRPVSSHKPTATAPSRQKKRELALQLLFRAALLFVLGVGYGILVTRLPQHHGAHGAHQHQHHRHPLTASNSPAHNDWHYLIFWGLAGVALGTLLPWFDRFWDSPPTTLSKNTNTTTNTPHLTKPTTTTTTAHPTDPAPPLPSSSTTTTTTIEAPVIEKPSAAAPPQADWALVVRGIGAFVGIVFAIRRLPWASTMQVSLTLALANPFLWYLIDRSKPGFLLSAAVGVGGAAVLMVMGCVCFGNIGRRLALNSSAAGRGGGGVR
ncbi:hypothetical protein NEMBOFW57_000227 [Staphylotrichum longicolle]|uniref:INSIG domain-containing protein n=1 Tax=Staphylotrichum longicolle TaxID=669026 RepID=A0AAD4EZP9_9PEZI|nr:hypothetical protein NEMBOFW57_000227 [Staphylotrichum longicolle]